MDGLSRNRRFISQVFRSSSRSRHSLTQEASREQAGAILEVLPRVVAAMLSLSALGYFVGWREANSYYTALGAAWAGSAIQPLTLLQLSATTVISVAGASFFSLVLLLDDRVSPKSLSWVCAALLVLAGLGLTTSQGLFGSISPSGSYAFAAVSSTLCALAAGFTLTEFFGRVRRSTDKALASSHLWLVYWFVLPGLFWAPDRLGQARALRDAGASSSPLPLINASQGLRPGAWRLVHIAEDKALLMLPSDNLQERVFKIVETRDIEIRSTSKATKP